MNEFDLRLESELRLFLDPISAVPVPPRRGKQADDGPTLRDDGRLVREGGPILRVVAPETFMAVPVEAY